MTYDDSRLVPVESGFRPVFRDNRGSRKLFVNEHGSASGEDDQDDDDYFPVPEVLDEP